MGAWRPSGKSNSILVYFQTAEAAAAEAAAKEKAAEEAANNTLAATITAAAITAAIASVTTATPDAAPEAAPAAAPSEVATAAQPHELAVVGTRVNIQGLFGVVWMVTPTEVAMVIDDKTWLAMEHSRFSELVFKELTFDPDTAVVGALHKVIDGDMYPSAFLYEVTKLVNPCWRLYSRVEPAPAGLLYAPPPLQFPLDAGDAIEVHQSVLPCTYGRKLHAALSNEFYFLGLLIGQAPLQTTEHVWAMVRSTHSHSLCPMRRTLSCVCTPPAGTVSL